MRYVKFLSLPMIVLAWFWMVLAFIQQSTDIGLMALSLSIAAYIVSTIRPRV